MKSLVVVVVLSGCVASNSVVCGDGRLCPENTVCDDTHALCVLPDQVSACAGAASGTVCTAGPITGNCVDGVCLHAVCGDSIVETGEACDDGNTTDGDGCSADCLSDETCGNGVIDTITGEQCDDDNHVEHDGCSSSCLTETPQWFRHTLTPTAWSNSTVAYDSRRDRIVMFGGLSGSNVFGETWEWTGADWIQFLGASPPPRMGAGLVFDPARENTVLFGGFDGGLPTPDTWTWDGTRWTARDVGGPVARFGHSMTYDSKRQRVILFGGTAVVGPTNTPMSLADTWEWDGSSWQSMATAHIPHVRAFGMMSYDPKRGVTVLAGGVDAETSSTPLPDTWEYDGTDWTKVSPPAGPVPQVEEGMMGYDVTSQRTILFGGLNAGGTATATTLAWDGASWTTVVAGGPSVRYGAAMVGTASQLVMYGGTATGIPFAETWIFANNTWTQAKDAGVRERFVMANDPVHARAIIFGGTSANGMPANLPATWDLSTQGFTLRANAPPTARVWPCLAYDPVHANLVMFGGLTTSAVVNETWTWDGAGWTQHLPAMSPGPRERAACAFDGHHVTVFGGFDGSNDRAEAWSWDGTTWAPATTPPPALTARDAMAAGYDPVRKQMVVVGGGTNSESTLFDETWLYDGTTWTQGAVATFRPAARYGAAMSWNPARQSLILTGGAVGASVPLDAYEWDGTRWHTIAAANTPPGRFDHGSISALDGAGIQVYGGDTASSVVLGDRWELRWDADHAHERCNAVDLDGDHLAACADPDCWWVCAPLCPPGTTCDPSAPKCGDGVCDGSRETCRSCPGDCTCASVCGDGICDPGEAGCPGDCP